MEKVIDYRWSAIIIPVLVAVLTPIIQGLVNNSGSKKKLGKEWRCKYKKSVVTYYVRLLISLLLLVILIPIIVGVLVGICIRFENINIIIEWAKWGGLVIYVGVMLGVVIINYKKKIFVTKKCSRYGGWFIIGMTLIDCLTIYCFSTVWNSLSMFSLIPYSIIMILELFGILGFDDKIIYQYKRARVVLDDNNTILDVESNAISIKDKWFIILASNGSRTKEIRVYQDKISKIEYYDKQY